MPCRFGHILLVLAAALLTGCGRPKVIPEDELVSLYVDMFIADQWLRDHPEEKKVADTTLFFDPLFREYGYTFEDYDRSVSYYVARPDRFSDITTRVADELKRMYAEMQEEEGRRDEGDSVYEAVDFRADSLWTDGLSLWPRKSRDTLARGNLVELKEMPLSMKTRHKAK